MHHTKSAVELWRPPSKSRYKHYKNRAFKEGTVLATADQYGNQLAVYGIEYALEMLGDQNAELADKETPVDLVTLESLR